MPNLKTIHTADLSACIAFLAEREHRCISLMSYFVTDGVPALPDRKVRAAVRFSETPIAPVDGIILVTNNGILFHCVREDIDLSQYAPVLGRFLGKLPIRCVIGSREHSIFLESFLGGTTSRAVDYLLMIFSPELSGSGTEPGSPLPDGIQLVRCTPDDTERLLPLQESYEIEEVAPPGNPVDRDVTRIALQQNLGTQHVFMALSGNTAVAKAGTNALGLAWVQMGGVFTVPHWRGKGLATALVRHIAKLETDAEKRVALFVKLTNTPAKKAYVRAGFRPDVFFRISYW